MNELLTLLSDPIYNILKITLGAAGTIVGTYAAMWMKEKGFVEKLEGNKKLAQTVVNSVEQVYIDANGPAKLQAAKVDFIQLLQSKNKNISEKEIELLIESAVNEMNRTFMQNIK